MLIKSPRSLCNLKRDRPWALLSSPQHQGEIRCQGLKRKQEGQTQESSLDGGHWGAEPERNEGGLRGSSSHLALGFAAGASLVLFLVESGHSCHKARMLSGHLSG